MCGMEVVRQISNHCHAAFRVCETGILVHGRFGYLKGSPVEQFIRGVIECCLFEEIWNGLPHRRIFFGVINHHPVESCVGCRQRQVVDCVGDPGAFLKNHGADEAVLKRNTAADEMVDPA